jgi:4-hydroxybenzoate polyprenyltransferase
MDVTILSLGYPIRLLFGGMITDIEISSLLFLTVFCLSLYFSLGKRYGEMSKNSSETREVLRSYSGSYLSHFMFLCMGLGIVFYSMWTIENSHSLLIYSVPFVLIICMKYHMLIEKTDGDPVNSFLSDKHLIILVALYVAFVSAILYL